MVEIWLGVIFHGFEKGKDTNQIADIDKNEQMISTINVNTR